MKYVKGGQKIQKFLESLIKVESISTNVGILENSTHSKTGTGMAEIAYMNEYGATLSNPGHKQSIFKKIKKNGDFAKKGKFVKSSQANLEETVNIKASTTVIPARPFFRNAIEKNADKWIQMTGSQLSEGQFNMEKVIKKVAKEMKSDIQQSIVDFRDPANAPATIQKKGFDKPLIDTGEMLKSIDFEIKSANELEDD